jgi:hypothetical protein
VLTDNFYWIIFNTQDAHEYDVYICFAFKKYTDISKFPFRALNLCYKNESVWQTQTIGIYSENEKKMQFWTRHKFKIILY